MRNTCLIAVLILMGGGCAHFQNHSSTDAQYEQLTAEFMTNYFGERPLAGAALGWHQYDGRFVVPDQATIAKEITELKHYRDAFTALDAAQLASAKKNDLRILLANITGELGGLERDRVYARNPMAYAGGVAYGNALDISVYLKRDFKPLAERVNDITAILESAPAAVAAARKNLDPVLAKPLIDTAIEAANGTATFLENDVAKAASGVTDKAVHAKFDEASKKAVAEFRSLADWLKQEKLPHADNSYALGRDAYREMLKTEMIELSPEQILELGMKELRAEQERFAAAAAVINPKLKPVEVFQALQHEHPTAAGLLPDTRKNLDAIRQFVIDHHLVTLASEVRARVEETLPPFRSTTFASMDTPGPFEKRATEAYYYVTPVEAEWPPAQQEEWLSAFNYYELDVTSIHEAYPGHYVQFLSLNASSASMVSKVFTSYAFVEGWAHYCERMLVDEGYGQPANPTTASHDELVRGAKYRLAQSGDSLLRICRLCCSVKLHCQGMTVDEATKFFMDNCYYEEKPARSEATRGTYDPGYLYYTMGKLMILKLRHDWQEQEGAKYSPQRFHDELLRHGGPPLPLLRQIMLKDPAKWPEIL